MRRKPREVSNDFKENIASNKHKTRELTNSELKENNGNKSAEEKIVNGNSTTHDKLIEIKDSTDVEASRGQEKELKSRKKEAKPLETPLTKRKPTPTKNNPLLKFLKNPAGKSKKPTKKEISSYIDLTLAEEEARDAWKCEKDAKESSSDPAGNSKNQPTDEDCTEDFCLQLEDTHESEIENRAEENQKSQNSKEVTEKSVQKETTTEILDNSNHPASSCNSSKVAHIKNNMEQKVPRRVALITLESPKGKKKQKP